MAMSDEAMFAPPQGITIEAVNGMLAERLAQKHGKASLLRAFIPLPPPFSPVQLIELHVLKSNFYYRYHDDGSDVTATVEYQARWSIIRVTPSFSAVVEWRSYALFVPTQPFYSPGLHTV